VLLNPPYALKFLAQGRLFGIETSPGTAWKAVLRPARRRTA